VIHRFVDGGFLLAIVAKLPGSPIASKLLQTIPAPIPLNFLHQLQAENLLIRFQQNGDPEVRAAGNQGLRFWRHYLEEGVFTLLPADWDAGFRNAITWNRMAIEKTPSPWLLIHPSLALASGATHFLSFDPRTRLLARSHGIKVLPEKL
jgi:hypothetical protein